MFIAGVAVGAALAMSHRFVWEGRPCERASSGIHCEWAVEFDVGGLPAAARVPQPAQDVNQSQVLPRRLRLVDHPRFAAALAPDAQEPAGEGLEGRREGFGLRG
jgi:hypothetical protein